MCHPRKSRYFSVMSIPHFSRSGRGVFFIISKAEKIASGPGQQSHRFPVRIPQIKIFDKEMRRYSRKNPLAVPADFLYNRLIQSRKARFYKSRLSPAGTRVGLRPGGVDLRAAQKETAVFAGVSVHGAFQAGTHCISGFLQQPQDQDKTEGLAACNLQTASPPGSLNNFY